MREDPGDRRFPATDDVEKRIPINETSDRRQLILSIHGGKFGGVVDRPLVLEQVVDVAFASENVRDFLRRDENVAKDQQHLLVVSSVLAQVRHRSAEVMVL